MNPLGFLLFCHRIAIFGGHVQFKFEAISTIVYAISAFLITLHYTGTLFATIICRIT